MRASLRSSVVLLLFFGLALSLQQPSVAAQEAPRVSPDAAANPSLSGAQIVSALEARNRQRTEALHAFEGTRLYHMEYEGFFGKHTAEMTVTMSYRTPSDKEFTVVSQTGSKFVIDHVFKGLLDGEREAGENHARTDLNSQNYNFTLLGAETTDAGPQYVLAVTPKTDYKYLYRGKIWVDASDFAVTRVEAEPARTPSFWIKKTAIKHNYEKVEEFWLPADDQTDSTIKLGGHALLSIQYTSYKILESASVSAINSDANSLHASAVPAPAADRHGN